MGATHGGLRQGTAGGRGMNAPENILLLVRPAIYGGLVDLLHHDEGGNKVAEHHDAHHKGRLAHAEEVILNLRKRRISVLRLARPNVWVRVTPVLEHVDDLSACEVDERSHANHERVDEKIEDCVCERACSAI